MPNTSSNVLTLDLNRLIQLWAEHEEKAHNKKIKWVEWEKKKIREKLDAAHRRRPKKDHRITDNDCLEIKVEKVEPSSPEIIGIKPRTIDKQVLINTTEHPTKAMTTLDLKKANTATKSHTETFSFETCIKIDVGIPDVIGISIQQKFGQTTSSTDQKAETDTVGHLSQSEITCNPHETIEARLVVNETIQNQAFHLEAWLSGKVVIAFKKSVAWRSGEKPHLKHAISIAEVFNTLKSNGLLDQYEYTIKNDSVVVTLKGVFQSVRGQDATIEHMPIKTLPVLKRGEIPLLFYPETYLALQDIYVQLMLIESNDNKQNTERKELKSTAETTQSDLMNHFENIHQPKTPIKLEELFKQKKEKQSIKRILIWGRAGIGKTILLQYLTQKPVDDFWQKLSPELSKIKKVVYVPLRILAQSYSAKLSNLADLVSFFGGMSLPEAERLVGQSQNILWLLDGYDEVAHLNNNHEVGCLLQELYKQPLMILSSRPQFGHDIPVDRRIENVGFDNQSVKQYIEKFSEVLHCDDSWAAQIQKMISQQPVLRGLSHIPILLELICSIYYRDLRLNDADEVTGLTQLYQKMEDYLVKRYLEKFRGFSSNELRESSSVALKTHCQEWLDALSRIAAHVMQDYGVLFKGRSIYELIGPKNTELMCSLQECGYLKMLQEETAWEECDFYFLHLSFQEYFAARYWANQLLEGLNNAEVLAKFKECLSQNKYHPRFENVWAFVAGLLADVSDNLKRKEALEKFWELWESQPKDVIGQRHVELSVRLLEENQLLLEVESVKALKLKIQSVAISIVSEGVHKISYGWKILTTCHRVSNNLVIPEYLRFLTPTASQERNNAMFAISISNTSCNLVIGRLLEMVESDEYALYVLAHLDQIEDDRVVNFILKLPEITEYSAHILANSIPNDHKVLNRFLEFLCHIDPIVKLNAAEVLIRFDPKNEQVINVLMKLLMHPESSIKLRAAKNLGRLRVTDDRVINVLISLFHNTDSNLRNEAIYVFIQLVEMNAHAITKLLTLLDDTESLVKASAAYALGQLGQKVGDRVIGSLLLLLDDAESLVKTNAAYALGQLGQTTDGRIIAGLLELLKDMDSGLRVNAATALVQLGRVDDRIIEELLSLLKDANNNVRTNTVSTLNKLGRSDDRVFDILLKILLTTKDESLLYNALNAITKCKISEEQKTKLAELIDGKLPSSSNVLIKILFWYIYFQRSIENPSESLSLFNKIFGRDDTGPGYSPVILEHDYVCIVTDNTFLRLKIPAEHYKIFLRDFNQFLARESKDKLLINSQLPDDLLQQLPKQDLPQLSDARDSVFYQPSDAPGPLSDLSYSESDTETETASDVNEESFSAAKARISKSN